MAQKEKDLLQDYLDSEFKRYDADFQARAKGFIRWYKQWRGILDKSGTSTKSRLFLNRTKVAVIGAVANVLDILFPSEDFFDVVGRNEVVDSPTAETCKKLLRWAIRVSDYIMAFTLYVLQAAIYGTTVGKIVPMTMHDRILEKKPVMMGEGVDVMQSVTTTEREETVNYARFEFIDIWDIRLDPNGLGVDRENSSGVFHMFRRRIAYLREQEKAGVYKRIDEVVATMKKKKGKGDDKDTRRASVNLPPVEYFDEDIPLVEYWGLIPKEAAEQYQIDMLDSELQVEAVITATQDFTVILRAERNTNPGQARMFVHDMWEPSGEKSPYGRGVPENSRGSQQALNVTVNMRLDNQAWSIAAPLVVNIDKLENPDEDLVAKVNWVIRGHGSVNDIAQFVQLPNVTGSSSAESQEFERHIADEAGFSKTVEASQSFGSNRTLGGISLAYSAASRPIRMIARGMEINGVSKGLKKMYLMLVARLDERMKVRITDDPAAVEYLTVDPLALALDVDVLPSGSFALTQKENLVQNMGVFFDFISKVPMVAQLPNWNWKYMAQKFYEASGNKDWRKVWIDNPPTPAQPGMPPGAGNAGQAQGQPGPAQAAEGADGELELLAAIGRMAGNGAGQGV